MHPAPPDRRPAPLPRSHPDAPAPPHAREPDVQAPHPTGQLLKCAAPALPSPDLHRRRLAGLRRQRARVAAQPAPLYLGPGRKPAHLGQSEHERRAIPRTTGTAAAHGLPTPVAVEPLWLPGPDAAAGLLLHGRLSQRAQPISTIECVAVRIVRWLSYPTTGDTNESATGVTAGGARATTAATSTAVGNIRQCCSSAAAEWAGSTSTESV